jgi:hypothetical protein
LNRVAAFDYLPAEVRRLNNLKPWWYAAATLLILSSGLAVAGIVAARDAGAWVGWVSTTFTAAQVTLNFFLVVLTYNLFASSSRVTEQNERIHRISQLPILVAEMDALSFDPYPSYEVRIFNEGSGPALDIEVAFDYRLKDGSVEVSAIPLGAGARIRIGVLNRSSHTGRLLLDARGIMLAKPWRSVDIDRAGAPNPAQTETLLGPYSLVIDMTYKDIYSQEGRTQYEAAHASGDVGIELVELVPPAIELGAEIKPIVFRRAAVPRAA